MQQEVTSLAFMLNEYLYFAFLCLSDDLDHCVTETHKTYTAS